MMLAGIPVANAQVALLAVMLRENGHDNTADTIARALENEQVIVALTVPDREAILATLDDPPESLADLRGVLLREHEWRLRHGL